MPEPIVSVNGLGKRYRIWTHSRPMSLSDRVEHLLHRGAPHEQPRREDIWALREVSFDVARGEVLGVIGPNGAGKSTLLSILARITEPTTGQAAMRGRVASLLEVGTGFHPELSGRDNIYLNGAILGMGRREVDEKYDEIVEFSGVGDFMDMPVKRYSSGMYVRLGFAIAAHVDPDVLLLDEVLAVGDQAFQQKCLRRIEELTGSGRTVLFVSHSPASVAQLCGRAIVINEGRLAFEGDVDDAIQAYLESPQIDGGATALQEAHVRDGTGEIRVVAVRVAAADGRRISPHKPVTFDVDLVASPDASLEGLTLDLGIWSATSGQPVTLSTRYDSTEVLANIAVDGIVTVSCEVGELPLRPSQYVVAVVLERHGQILDACRHQTEFTIQSSDDARAVHLQRDAHSSLVVVRQNWIAGSSTAKQATMDTVQA